ncbi:MAG: DUF1178 family protein [Pseudomonadota bacterium]|nr:DUF1178 family protein [Pseudomonadota bacterium]
MKVLDLRCQNGHVFEGWFASDDDFMSQNGRGLIECPLCADKLVVRTPTAPRLNLSGAKAPAQAPVTAAASSSTTATPATASPSSAVSPVGPPTMPAEMQAAWIAGVRQLLARTEDVGPRFAEEARRIHYGEIPSRGIRGQATPEDRAALQEEGIETMAIPVPRGLDGPLQ